MAQAYLHALSHRGHPNVMTQLLTANPTFVHAVNSDGWTTLHCAARGMKSEESKSLFAKLLELNPGALRAVTRSRSKTPFDIAVEYENECAIEALRGELSLDEIAFSTLLQDDGEEEEEEKEKKKGSNSKDYKERLVRPVVERQCECLNLELLNRDVMLVVFGYLGFNPVLKKIASTTTTTNTTTTTTASAANENKRLCDGGEHSRGKKQREEEGESEL